MLARLNRLRTPTSRNTLYSVLLLFREPNNIEIHNFHGWAAYR